MSLQDPIVFWNRKESRNEVEKVYGDAWIRRIYGTPSGRKLADNVLSKSFLSKMYGAYQSSTLSGHKVEPFIREFQIPMEEYLPGPYRTFNDFFIRQFRDGARPFVQDAHLMPAFSEARYFAYDRLASDGRIPVKGISLSPAGLLGDSKKAKPFGNGPVLLARLCPTDYHRFHFPDDGRVSEAYSLHGPLHSVNPLALSFNGDILITNERQVSLLETRNFGKLAYVEVGALCVGRIVQSHPEGESFKRGVEKGYFLFGGSTVVVLGEPGAWRPDADLLERTQQGTETLVRLGERVAESIRNRN